MYGDVLLGSNIMEVLSGQKNPAINYRDTAGPHLFRFESAITLNDIHPSVEYVVMLCVVSRLVDDKRKALGIGITELEGERLNQLAVVEIRQMILGSPADVTDWKCQLALQIKGAIGAQVGRYNLFGAREVCTDAGVNIGTAPAEAVCPQSLAKTSVSGSFTFGTEERPAGSIKLP